MSDGTDDCYVFVRYWPGYSEAFPFGHFDTVDDQHIEFELRHLLAVELWRRRAEIHDVLRKRRSQFLHRTRVARPHKHRTLTRRNRRFPKHHQFRQLAKLVGWHDGVGGLVYGTDPTGAANIIDVLTSTQIWLCVAVGEQKAKAIAATLADLTLVPPSDIARRRQFRPRYGYVKADSMSFEQRAKCKRVGWTVWSNADTDFWGELVRVSHPEAAHILGVLRMPSEEENPINFAANSGARGSVGESIAKGASSIVIAQESRRVKVSLSPPQVVIDGTPFRLEDDEAVCLNMLLESRDWTPGHSIATATAVARPDRQLRKIKKILAAIGDDVIQSVRGKGHRLRPDLLA